ncbi:hypothetical protein LC653_33440 [Nostoc sp. CHAB 5784]|nr:hypothetical protein [Nostoc mirabile CHAB5784]
MTYHKQFAGHDISDHRRHRILKLARTIADLARKYCSRGDCLY